MRVDAQRNYEHLLDTGRVVVVEQGAEASLRDVARRAGVGLGTLYRHFPSREALLEALLRESFDKLAAQAAELEAASAPADALIVWLRDFVAFSRTYRGVTEMMMAAIENTESALHTSCVRLRGAGTQLLTRAQAAGAARPDMDGTDLFALVAALAWLGDQPSSATRAGHLFDIIASAILVNRASGDSLSEPP
jgi:AcrR family transcriptional regulator